MMSRVGRVRKPIWPLLQWCETIHEKDAIDSQHYLLCFDNPGYCRVFNLDDGRIYHMTNDDFDAFTEEVR